MFIHDLKTDGEGKHPDSGGQRASGLGLRLSYNTRYLPYFMEWKSTASGDYVIGLEPSNSSVYGRPYHEERGTVHRLAPFEKETNVLRFTVLDGKEEISAAVSAFEDTYHL